MLVFHCGLKFVFVVSLVWAVLHASSLQYLNCLPGQTVTYLVAETWPLMRALHPKYALYMCFLLAVNVCMVIESAIDETVCMAHSPALNWLFCSSQLSEDALLHTAR